MLFKSIRRKHDSGYNYIELRSDDTTLLSDGFHIYDTNNRIVAAVDKNPSSKYMRIRLFHEYHIESMSHGDKLK